MCDYMYSGGERDFPRGEPEVPAHRFHQTRRKDPDEPNSPPLPPRPQSLARREGLPPSWPFFVVISMAIGIAIGKALSISDFALTPPIDAIKAIVGGTFVLSAPKCDLAGRAGRAIRDDVPGDDECPPRRGG